MITRKISRYYNTVRYLKFIQLYYRIFYYLRSILRILTNYQYREQTVTESMELHLQPSIVSREIYSDHGFSLLNRYKEFKQTDWNFSGYGLLWQYNLNYFDYLNQENIAFSYKLNLILDFIQKYNTISQGLDPYPTSLRIINWIKFLTLYKEASNDIGQETKNKINASILVQVTRLLDNLEYHLLANHLLENGFALLFASYYLKDNKLYYKAKTILNSEIREQILDDGSHFELSPMYHQIILFRILDSINLIRNNSYQDHELNSLLTETSVKMIRWMNAVCFKNGDIPRFNDTAKDIAPDSAQLINYAKTLGLNTQSGKDTELTISGYRKHINNTYEIIVDIGNIGPDYQPGHAHCDTFSFELYLKNKPVIVNRGTSTYENNKIRMSERSTGSHNTVQVADLEQSEVWSAFRVGRRARVQVFKDEAGHIQAKHDGYKKYGIYHTRDFRFNNKEITISDTVTNLKGKEAYAFLHFYPGISFDLVDDTIKHENFSIFLDNNIGIHSENYYYAESFNKSVASKRLRITFKDWLNIKFDFGR